MEDCLQQVRQLQTGDRAALFAIVDEGGPARAGQVKTERKEASALDFEDDFEIVDVHNP